jgi:glycosyltransferase involved in cell wall biosynthesis
VDRSTPSRWPAALYSWIQARRIARFERAICQQVDCVLAVSDEDAAALSRFRSQVAVIPNGIFAEHYSNNPEQLDLGPHVLTFTGKMDYRPNVDAMLWFTAEVLPLIRERVPDVRLYIVGQKPHTRLEALRDSEAVFLTGWVPEIHPFLRATTVYIAPLRMGSGTRLKILEAMAAGCAVAATSLAAAGLPDDARQTLKIADTAPFLAQVICNLLQDDDERQQLGAAAQAAVYKHYDWSVLIPRLLTVYKEIGLG